MDFKIAGTRSGITAIQLDCKPKGIPLEILIEAMNKASVGRAKVIDVMEKTISTPNIEAKENASSIYSYKKYILLSLENLLDQADLSSRDWRRKQVRKLRY